MSLTCTVRSYRASWCSVCTLVLAGRYVWTVEVRAGLGKLDKKTNKGVVKSRATEYWSVEEL